MILESIHEWIDGIGGPRSSLSVGPFGSIVTDVGKQRNENQDRAGILRVVSSTNGHGFICAALCDGMGGHAHGAQAASIGLANFFFTMVQERKEFPERRLERSVQAASAAIRKQYPQSGATISACLLEANRIVSLNVGDSRIYAFSSQTNAKRLQRLTVDDTMEEAFGSEGRGLLQYLGMQGPIVPHINTVEDMEVGGLLITSDGAHMIGDNLIEQLHRGAKSKDELVSRIVDVSNWIGGVDNATAIFLDVAETQASLRGQNNADVSIWSSTGQLKISWFGSAGPSHAHAPPAAPQSVRSDIPSTAKPPDQAAQSTKSPANTREADKTKPRKSRTGSTRRKKESQIIMGFGEDGEK